MRYESEILYDLMKRDGLINPSQEQLPYESELKEKYVDEVKGAYPKVTDYRPEWLNYNLGYYIPADFPIESLENVTAGTVNNVVPYAFKSAILKGCTLVNLATKIKRHDGGANITFTDTGHSVKVVFNSDRSRVVSFKLNQTLKSNTKYLFIAKCTKNFDASPELSFFNGKDSFVKDLVKANNNGKTIITTTDASSYTHVTFGYHGGTAAGNEFELDYPVLVEYQDGMENWDIPYFEGMQSVKMPVLTTTGKNLFNGKLEYGEISATGIPNNEHYKNRKRSIDFIKVEPNTSYVFSTNMGESGINWRWYDNNKIFISSTVYTKNATSPNNAKYLKFYNGHEESMQLSEFKIQIEEGSTATSYEPYKSNILTVNEPVELRGIGDVQDTLDCLTGKKVERIGEIVLDGTIQPEGIYGLRGNTIGFYYHTNTILIKYNINQDLLMQTFKCDKLTIKDHGCQWNDEQFVDEEFISASEDGRIAIRLLSSKASTIGQFCQYLQSNPITVQYQLAEESIKTVDLTNVNQDGVPSTFRPFEGTMHLITDGTPLKPLFNGEIPVEATTQNLASFVNLEGVERTVNEYEEIDGDDNNEQLL